MIKQQQDGSYWIVEEQQFAVGEIRGQFCDGEDHEYMVNLGLVVLTCTHPHHVKVAAVEAWEERWEDEHEHEFTGLATILTNTPSSYAGIVRP